MAQDLVADYVEVLIKKDGSVLWVNTVDGCVLRICGIKDLTLIDDRHKVEP